MEKGDKIKVLSLDSYRAEAQPKLPVITEVVEVTDYPMIIVKIEGKKYEMYEGQGYEAWV